jgi:selenocysteine-specific elongation factor
VTAEPRQRVVATAGHVDHGKSALVRALTGTDPDRLAEERARGLTIDLGFAFTTVGSGPGRSAHAVAFVDVPGHARFLTNMLAGVGGVDAVVLVVAATEGWRAQSEEHLRIVELLGIGRGLAVVSKGDLVDPAEERHAVDAVRERLAASSLAGCPVVACDSRSGRGVAEVAATLAAVLDATPPAADHGRPRLWVDRSFTVRGAGTVVTGTLTGGAIAAGDAVVVLPGARPARVRGIEQAHRAVAAVAAGSRVALNLAGIGHAEVVRGDAVALAGQWREATAVDVELVLLPGAELPRRGRCKAHVGSGEHDVVVRPLGDGRHARVRLGGPLPLAPGDRLVLRDPGRQATIGGAVVLDVDPPGRAAAAPDRLVLDAGPRLLAGRPWLAVADLVPLAGVDGPGSQALADDLVARGAATRVGDHLAEPAALSLVARALRDAVDAHQRDHPLVGGLGVGTAAARLALSVAHVEAAVGTAADLEVVEGRIRVAGASTGALADPRARAFVAALAAAPFTPPAPAPLGVGPDLVRALVRDGVVVDLGSCVLTTGAWAEARRRLVRLLAEQGTLTVAQARDALGSTRKYTLAVLARLDAEGVTLRRGDDRLPGPRATLPPRG